MASVPEFQFVPTFLSAFPMSFPRAISKGNSTKSTEVTDLALLARHAATSIPEARDIYRSVREPNIETTATRKLVTHLVIFNITLVNQLYQ